MKKCLSLFLLISHDTAFLKLPLQFNSICISLSNTVFTWYWIITKICSVAHHRSLCKQD